MSSQKVYRIVWIIPNIPFYNYNKENILIVAYDTSPERIISEIRKDFKYNDNQALSNYYKYIYEYITDISPVIKEIELTNPIKIEFNVKHVITYFPKKLKIIPIK